MSLAGCLIDQTTLPPIVFTHACLAHDCVLRHAVAGLNDIDIQGRQSAHSKIILYLLLVPTTQEP